MIAQGAPLDPGRVRLIFEQTLRALSFAHSKGLAHRDLKPANVFLQRMSDAPVHVKLLDFGLAKFVAGERVGRAGPALTKTGTIVGTPAYMSPEQGTGQGGEAPSDVYSAGIVLFEMLTGERPYRGEPVDLIRHHLVTPLPSNRPRLPGPVGITGARRLPRKGHRQGGRRAVRERRRDAGGVLPTRDPRHRDAGAERRHGAAQPRAHRGGTAGSPRGLGSRARADGHRRHRAELGGRHRRGEAPVAPRPVADRAGCGGDRARGADGRGALRDQPRRRGRSDRGADGERRGRSAGHAAGRPPPAAHGDDGTVTRSAEAGEETAEEDDGFEGAIARVAEALAGEEEQDTAEEPVPTVAPAVEANGNPWEPPVPRTLASIRRAIRSGREMSNSAHRTLRRYAQRNRDDARVFLLLGHGYYSRGWRPDAIERYERAYSLDPNVKNDPLMSRNLALLSGHGHVGRQAQRLLTTVYGAESRHVVDEALAGDALDGDERERLRAFRDSL